MEKDGDVTPWRKYVHDLYMLANSANMPGITLQQIAVMGLLYLHKKGMIHQDIREHVRISKSACYDLMDRLEECGDVRIVTSKPRTYALTEQGKRMVRLWYLGYWKQVTSRA